MVSSSCTCIIRLPSPSNSTTVRSGRARRHAHRERDAVADRAELADGEELLLGTRGICAKNHEQWPPEFTISQSCGNAFSSASTTSRGSRSPGSISKAWLSGFESRMRAAMASLRQAPSRAGQRRDQCVHTQPRIGSQVMARDLLPLGDRDRIDVDLQHLRLRPELPAASRRGRRASSPPRRRDRLHRGIRGRPRA
jgi:hypothetical protein